MYSQRLKALSLGSGTVIYFGLPKEQYPTYSLEHNDYLVWIGRMDHGKAPDIAIEVAKRSNHRIVLMGPSYHYPFAVDNVLPQVDGNKVIWLRGCSDDIKQRVLLKAKALIAPLWNGYMEMFGIVNIEALACGVPVIGWNNDAQPSAIGGGEIIDHGKHGFIVRHTGYGDNVRDQSINCAVDYLKDIENINRVDCRQRYEEHFTSDIMTRKTLWFMEIVRERGTVEDVTREL